MDERNNNGIDRLSNIPESLIHAIFSLMDMKTVVQTSVLSRRWRNLWSSSPIITFSFDMFTHGFKNIHSNRNHYLKFVKNIDQLFIVREISGIQRINLLCGKQRNCDMSILLTPSLNSWIISAKLRRIQEFYLDVSGVTISRFPHAILNCTSLVKLELELGQNSNVLVVPASMNLPRLTFLKFDSLPSGGDFSLVKFLSKCPVIQSLVIEGDLGPMDHQIYSLTLKHLEIIDLVSKTSSKVRINSPNLVSFKCVDYISKCYILENVASLVSAEINIRVKNDETGRIGDYASNHRMFLRALSKVKELRLSEWFLLMGLKDFWTVSPPLQFINLRFIELETFLSPGGLQKLGWLLRISPYIEDLSIVITPGMQRSDMADREWTTVSWPPCRMDHLRSVEVRGVLGNIRELKLVELILKCAVALQTMCLYGLKKSTTDDRLISFGKKLPTLQKASSMVSTFLV